MKIVIAGGGKVGEVLCRELAQEGNDIVLIEKDPDILDRIINKLDIKGIVGRGENFDNLTEAEVQTCDIFIAVTPQDEMNIISAIIAKKLGADHTIARVRNPMYADHMAFVREDLGISMLMNPELEAAKEINLIIRFPEALSVEQFFNGRVSIVELIVKPDSQLAGTPITDFRQRYGDVLICAVDRQAATFIPSGDHVLTAGDRIFVTGSQKSLFNFLRKTKYETDRIKSVLIIGASRIVYYLLPMLEKLRIKVKIIENKPKRAQQLSEAFPQVTVIEGDGTNHEFLREEHINQYDAVINLTGIDEENILNSLFALKQGAQQVITKVNRTDLLETVSDFGLQSIITPKQIIANGILSFVRSFGNTRVSNIEKLYRIANNRVEALEFVVKADSQVVNVPLAELPTKPNLLVAYLVRDEQLIFPTGTDTIQPGDHVIIITMNKEFDDIDDILMKRKWGGRIE